MANAPTIKRASGNKVSTSLASSVASNGLSLTVVDASGLSSNGGYIIIDEAISAKREILYYVSKAGNVLTVADNGRGTEGTTAVAHDAGATVTDIIVASHVNDIADLLAISLIPTGTVLSYSGTSAPTGFLLSDGSAISRTTYASLFSLIGTTYGVGNGTTTFNLPNLKGKVVVGIDASQTEFDTLAETGGAKTHTLDITEMPYHRHSIPTQHPANHWNSGFVLGADGVGNAITSNTGYAGGTGGVTQAHNNLQPYIVLNYIIKT